MHYVPLLAHLRKYGIAKIQSLQRRGDEVIEVELSILDDPFWQSFAQTWP